MKTNDKSPDAAAELRQRAEAAFREKAATATPESLTPEVTRQLLHELQVHQIELEMQNEELRRAQLELDAARTRYFDLYDLAPAGYCTLNETGLILEANLTLVTELGVARGALVSQPFSRFIHKEDADRFYLLGKQLLATGQPQMCEVRMVSPAGPQFWALLAATAAPPGMRVVLSDITERKQTEESIARLAAIVESSDDAIIGITPDRIITSWNKGAQELFGYAAGEMVGTSVLRLIPAQLQDEDEEEQIMRKIMRGESFEHYETLRQTKDGRRINISLTVSPIKDAAGHIIGASKVARDITARKRAEAALQDREARYEAMVHSINDGIISADSQDHIIGWNPGAEKMFGYPENEIFGQPFSGLMPDRFHASHLAGLPRVCSGGVHHVIGKTVEVEGRRKDGREFPITLSLSEWQVGGQPFFTAIIHDITERKQTEERIKSQLDELQRWQDVMLGREDRVLEVKREVNELRRRAGEPVRYPSLEGGSADSEAAKPAS